MSDTERKHFEPIIVVIRPKDVVQLVAAYKEPCRYFAKYRGIKAPGCGCLPCVTKYAEECKKKGLEVIWL